MTNFEVLCNDLLFEIFDYLSFEHILNAFLGLNQHLNDLVRHYPMHIPLTKLSIERIVRDGPFHCKSLLVKSVSLKYSDAVQPYFNFDSIQSIEFTDTDCTTILSILNAIPINQLKTIEIRSLDENCQTENVGLKIWSMIALTGGNKLRCMDVSLHLVLNETQLFLFDLPNLQYAILHHITIKGLSVFLTHSPNLCSLVASLTSFVCECDASQLDLSKLMYLKLRIENAGLFEYIYRFLSMCSNLIQLELRFWETEVDAKMAQSNSWEMLIEQCLCNLQYVKIVIIMYPNMQSLEEKHYALGNSEFWRSRHPNFQIEYFYME